MRTSDCLTGLLIAALLLAGLAILALSTPARLPAQEPSAPAAQEPAPHDSVGPRPISTAEFGQEEEAARALIDTVQALILPDPDVQAVTDQLARLSAELSDLVREPEVISPERYPLRRVANLRSQWSAYGGRIESWRRVLRDRISELESADARLEALRARVAVTDSALVARGGSELLRLRIEQLLEDIDAAQNQLAGTIEGTLAIQERLLSEQARVADQIAVFDARFRNIRERLLTVESPPLWALFSDRGTGRTGGASLEGAVAAIRDFAAENRSRLLFQLAFVSFLAVGFLVFRRRAEGWTHVDALRGPLHVLHHPVSTAVITGLLLTLVLYDAPPVEVTEIGLLISVLPVVALLRGLVGHALRPALYVISAVLVLDLIATNLDWVPVLGRLLLLGETGVGIAGLLWLVRKDSPARRVDAGAWWRASLVGARLATALLGVAFVANVMGNRSLAELLTSGVVRSAYLGVLLFAGASIGKGVVALLPRTELGNVLRGVRRHADVVVRRLQRPVDWAAFLVWIWLTARSFAVADLLFDWSRSTLARVWSIGSIQVTLGGILLFFLTIWIAFKVSELTRFVLAEEVLDRLDLPRGVPGTISTLSHYAILMGGLLLALAVAGIDLSRITLVAGALGVGIGFGLQGLVNNFVSGLILIFERPISVGDAVAIGPIFGYVQRIGMRSTTVLTFDGAEVIVPNGNLIANDVTNWTLTDQRRRVQVQVGAAYGSDPEKILRILTDVAEGHEEVLAYPEPMVLFTGFGESSLDFSLRAWVRSFEGHLRVQSELTTRVYAAFSEHGVEIPFPQRDLHLKSVPQRADLAWTSESGGDGDIPTRPSTEAESP